MTDSRGLQIDLAKKLAITTRSVNRRIKEKEDATLQPRHVAALMIAAEAGLSVKKYASAEELSELRAAQGSANTHAAPTVVAQTVRPARTRATAPQQRNPGAKRGRTVMVVYGRDGEARKAMFDFLESLDLKPMSWTQGISQTKIANPTVRQIVDALFAKAVAVVVLLTPDDEARLKPEFHKKNEPSHEIQLTGQARPNVLFEAGMAMSSHPDRTVMTQIGDVKPFTDIGGIHVTHLNNSIETRRELAAKLVNAKCQVDMDDDKWRDAGNFELEEANENG